MSASFFTQVTSYKLPHDRIDVRWILVAHQAITVAFELIRREGFALSSAKEIDITVKLEKVLNNQVINRNGGIYWSFFGKVRRVEVVNYNETKKSKRPDLCFDLRRENQVDLDQLQDAIFAECKPVDNKHLLKDHYCAVNKDCTGIERFVAGDYAWAMEQALMIGYVRDGISIVPHLADELKNTTKKTELGNPTVLEICPMDPSIVKDPMLYQTTHNRLFQWRNGKQATPIDLFHSWHECV